MSVNLSSAVTHTETQQSTTSFHLSEKAQHYWKENLTIIGVLLAVWFGVSYFAGIMICDQLNAFSIGGFPLGFWFANQGSEVIFVLLIVVYVQLMNNLDRKYDVHEGD